MSNQDSASGVQELIDRLSQEGVAEGQRQADQLVSDARKQAADLLEAARAQASEIIRQAREEAEHFQTAGEEALGLAARDTVRDFGSKIHAGWRSRLQELVKHELRDPELIRRMMLAIAQQAGERVQDEAVNVLLSTDMITDEEARRQVEEGRPDSITEFVHGLIGEDLREGFSVDFGSRRQTGLTVRVVNQQVEVDLSSDAIAELLGRHLLPRYRAIMRKASASEVTSENS